MHPMVNLMHLLTIVADPNEWSEMHVNHWINWAIKEFRLLSVNPDLFKITGKELCNMQHAEFMRRVPHDKGDVFWTHLELLRKCKFVGKHIQSSAVINC